MTTKAFYWELGASQTGNQLLIREDERLAPVGIVRHHGEFTAGTEPQQLVGLVSLRGGWDQSFSQGCCSGVWTRTPKRQSRASLLLMKRGEQREDAGRPRQGRPRAFSSEDG